MVRYCINPETGRPNLCTAKTPKKCDYYNGDTNTEAPHFANKTEARSYVEQEMTKEYGDLGSLTKSNNKDQYKKQFEKEYNEYFKEIENKRIQLPIAAETVSGPLPYALRERGERIYKREDLLKDFETEEGYTPYELKNCNSDYIYVLMTRQGGGNRECWCDDPDLISHDSYCISYNNEYLQEHPEYLYDQDDIYDSTYATFYFKADTKNVEQFFKDKKEYDNYTNKKNVKEKIEHGETPPWAIRKEFNTEKFNEYKAVKYVQEQSLKELDRLNNNINTIYNLIKKM